MLLSIINRLFKRQYDPVSSGITTLEDLNGEITKSIKLFDSREIQIELNKSVESPSYLFEEKNIHIFKNVMMWPWINVLSDLKGRLISETAFTTNTVKKIYTNGWCKEYPVVQKKGYVTSIEYGPWDNYYHWNIDSLPRIYGLYNVFCRKINQITLLVNKKLNNEEHIIFKSLLPENVIIEEVRKNIRIKPDNFIFLPYLSGDCAGYLPEVYLEFYTDRIFKMFRINRNAPKTKKIFISRQCAAKRQIKNEDEVSTFLKQYGFESYQLEKLTIKKQVELFNSASYIIGQHGAGLTNLLYSSNAKVIEIFSNQIVTHHNHYRLLANSKDLDYTSVHLNGNHKNDDVLLPVDKLLTLLNK